VNLTKGSVRAQVKETKNFIVQTSVSVASVKGTDFWFISDTNTGDSIVGLEGIVTLTNRISGEKIDVKSGITGLSSKSGSLESFQTDPKNIPIDPSEGDQSEKQLEILFKNSAGEEKKLIIEYK
jgi:ferric-dicitrate binding protein FerR (iron transport regulator)